MPSSSKIDNKLAKIYYSQKGYWYGNTAIKHFATAAAATRGSEVPEEDVKNGLKNKQYGRFIFLRRSTFLVRNSTL